MITTRFEPYCENCRELEVETETIDFDLFSGEQRRTCIYCAHESRCRAIRDSIRQENDAKIAEIRSKKINGAAELNIERLKERYECPLCKRE